MSLKKQGNEQTGSYQEQGPEWEREECGRAFGQAATTDTTAVIRPPQNKPEEHSSL